MKYCIVNTQSLPRTLTNSNCLININDLIIREGYNEDKSVFANELVIDVDMLEREVAISEDRLLNKSMDMAFVVKNQTEENKEIVLVELKLNHVNNLRHLSTEAILSKVLHTCQLLNNVIPFHNKYFFIFKLALKEQAKSRFNRLFPTIPNSFIPTDINELKTTFFD